MTLNELCSVLEGRTKVIVCFGCRIVKCEVSDVGLLKDYVLEEDVKGVAVIDGEIKVRL